MANPSVLVVEDEPSIAELLSTALRHDRFVVDVALNGRQAIDAARRHRPDLVLLDVGLPDLDGFAVARALSADGARVPTIFLTARDEAEDKLHGLALGDDYVTKPFSIDEVVARVRAVLRRTEEGGHVPANRLQFADIVVDDDTHEVWRNGRRIELSVTEHNLLRYLMANPRRALSKAQILAHVWSYDFDGSPNVVETYISYLRRKLERHGPPIIHTIRGVGYCLRISDE